MKHINRRNYPRLAASTLAIAAAVAVATTWGPFLVQSVATFRNITSYQVDRDLQYYAAMNIARIIMNTTVQKIKRGDIIRVQYPDGSVYDYETITRCPVAAPCPVLDPTQVASADAPSTASQYATDRGHDLSCGHVAGTPWSISIPTGRWVSDTWWNQATQQMGTTATYMSTGSFTLTFEMGRSPNCP